jgi:hypothetical protein
VSATFAEFRLCHMCHMVAQVAGCVIEFTGGPGSWSTRTYSGGRNLGSTGEHDLAGLLCSAVTKLLLRQDGTWPAQGGLEGRVVYCSLRLGRMHCCCHSMTQHTFHWMAHILMSRTLVTTQGESPS